MAKNTSIWLAGLSAAALISGAALAQDAGQKMNEAAAHTDAATDQAAEALQDAASATGTAASNAGEAVADTARNAADATGEAVTDAAQATRDTVRDGAAATAEMADEATDGMTTRDPAEIAEGTPVEGQMFRQDENTFLASTILDATIINVSGENVGDVNDLVVTSDGTVTGVVVGVGGFLGLGEKDVAIEMDRIDIRFDDDGDLQFSINETEEALENAPEFVTSAEQRRERERDRAATTAPTTAVPGQ